MIRQPWIAWLFALLLLWAPIPFGSVTDEARAALYVGVLLVFVLTLFGDEPHVRRPPFAVSAALLGVGAIGTLQLLPLPRSLVGLLSPVRLERAEATEALLGEPARGLLSLTFNPQGTAATSISFLVAAAALWAASALAQERSSRRVMGSALMAVALFETIYGGARFMGDTNRIWGVQVEGAEGRFRGTFVNPDHFAFFIGLVLPIVFAWGWWLVHQARRSGQVESWLAVLAGPGVVWIALFVGMALSGSRGGLLSTLAATAVQGALVRRAGGGRGWSPVGIVVGAIGVGAVALLALQQGLGRLLESSPAGLVWSARFTVYRASLELVRDFAATGSGLGTFREVFPLVQPQTDLPGTWWHAHNDFLEIAITAGVLGLLLVLVGGIALVRRLTLVLEWGRRSEDRAAGLAAIGAVVAATIHSLFDFSLTMPANALTLAVVCGAGAAAGIRTRPNGDRTD